MLHLLQVPEGRRLKKRSTSKESNPRPLCYQVCIDEEQIIIMGSLDGWTELKVSR